MSLRASRRILWVALLAMLPLPMLAFDASIPVIRYLLLAGVTVGLILAEGMGAIPGSILGLIALHAVVYAALLWAVAWLLARLLVAMAPRASGALTIGVVVAALVVTSLFDVYTTPFAATSARTSLLHVLE